MDEDEEEVQSVPPPPAPKKKSTVPGRVGHAMVGRTIEVYWAADDEWQEGRVLAYNPATGKHTVEYLQQGAREQLTLAREQWRQVCTVRAQCLSISMLWGRR